MRTPTEYPNQYIGDAEDLDELGIPRSHTVVHFPKSADESRESPKPETKPSETGPKPPKPGSKR